MADNKIINTTFKVGAEDTASPTIERITKAFNLLDEKMSALAQKDPSKAFTNLEKAQKSVVTIQAQLMKLTAEYNEKLKSSNVSAQSQSNYLAKQTELTSKLKDAQLLLNKALKDAEAHQKNNVNLPNKNKNNSSSNIADSLSTISGIAITGYQALELVKMADSYKLLQSRLKQVTTSTEEYNNANRDLIKIANENGQSLEATATLFVRVRQGIRDIGGSYQDAITVISTVNSAIRMSGATALEAYSAQLQFSQALASGKLRGDELRSMMENAPALAKALADGLKVPIGKLYELGEAGSLTSKVVIDALKTQKDAMSKMASDIPLTLEQSIEVLKNNVTVYIGSVDSALGVTNGLSSGVKFLADNLNVLIPIIEGLAATLTVLAGAKAVLTVIEIAKAFTVVGRGLMIASVAIGALVSLTTAFSSMFISQKDKEIKAQKDFNKELDNTIMKGTLVEKITAKISANSKIESNKGSISSIDKEIELAQANVDKVKANSGNAFNKDFEVEAMVKLQELRERKARLLKDNVEIESKIANIDSSIKNNNNQSLLDMRAALGLDKLKSDTGILGSATVTKELKAIDTAFEAFNKKTKQNSGELAISLGELKNSLDTVMDGIKTSDFGEALKVKLDFQSAIATTDEAKYVINKAREKLVSKLEQLQKTDLEESVVLMKNRLDSLSDIQKSIVSNNKTIFDTGFNLKQVFAELKNDLKAINDLNRVSSEFAIKNTTTEYNNQLSIIKKIEQEKKSSVSNSTATKLYSVSEESLKLKKQYNDKLFDIYAKLGVEGRSDLTDSQYNDYIKPLNDKYLEDLKKISDSRIAIDKDAADKIKLIEQEVLDEKRKALTAYRDSLVSQSEKALSSYKTYAEKVIALDKQISNNRLQTQNDVNNIKRQSMTSKEKDNSYRDELMGLQSDANAAYGMNDKERAKELLAKQKDVVNNIISNGYGDPEKLKQEAIAEMERIGAETEAILQEEKQAATEAANQQMSVYENLATVIQNLGTQLTSLNEQSVVNLQAKIDDSSLNQMITSIQDSLNSRVFTVQVQANYSDASSVQGFATGGHIRGPGSGTSDSIHILASNGEYMIRAAAVERLGVDFFDAINFGGYVPKFATGGLVEGFGSKSSVNNYIQMPNGGYEKLPTNAKELSSFQDKLNREKIKRGKR